MTLKEKDKVECVEDDAWFDKNLRKKSRNGSAQGPVSTPEVIWMVNWLYKHDLNLHAPIVCRVFHSVTASLVSFGTDGYAPSFNRTNPFPDDHLYLD